MKQIWRQRYQILEEAGKGGNGRVYKVWDLHLEKEWAMKILEGNSLGFSMFGEEGMIDELQVLKRISHSNFPRVVDAFEEDDRKVLIMDYIKGVTLEEIIQKGPMKEKEILTILQQVCEAILYLHHQTPVLLFLDLKPSNIIVEETGMVKLVDVGSVIIKGSRGNISGSFGFASPEQIRIQKEGVQLSEQSDIFSFGMVLYAMTVGDDRRMPIVEAGSRFGIFIRKKKPQVSSYLERILEKCTRGVWQRRYGSMREVQKELEQWEKGLKKKKVWIREPFFYRYGERKRWYQEKSIFCTEGRHSFYIAKKILVLVLCLLCICPGMVTQAGKKQELGEIKERVAETVTESLLAREEEENPEELTVFIRDKKYRKVLVKKGCAYEVDTGVFLEIPREAIEGKKCRIVVECEDEGEKKKYFSIECICAK